MKGSMRQRSPGSWELAFDMGTDANGKRRQKFVTFRGGKREAQAELNRILADLQSGAYVEPAKETVAQFLERWLRDYAKSSVTAKTLEGYENIARLHLAPVIGYHPLSKLAPVHIQEYYSRALEGGRRGGGSLSASSVLHHHRVLREALQWGVKLQLLARNPADAVEPPRPERKEMRALDADDTRKLLEAVSGSRLYTPILLAVTTGMRRGEILALRWADVDLVAATATVCQSLQQVRGELTLKQPKTARSRRVVSLPALAVDALIRHKARQAETRLLLGPDYRNLDLVNANPDGTPMSPGAFTHAFILLAKKAGLPGLRFHDLRHGHASQLGRMNVPVKVISERLGHSSVAITLDLYSHVLPGMQEDAARKIDAALREGTGG
jgi:integrase